MQRLRYVKDRLLTVAGADEDVRRRGRIMLVLILILWGLVLLALPINFLADDPLPGLISLLGSALIYALVFWLARRGYVSLSAWLTCGTLTIALTMATALVPGQTTIPFFLAITLLIAGLTLPPAQIWITLAGTLVLLLGGLALFAPGWFSDAVLRNGLFTAVLMLIFTTVIGFTGALVTRNALRIAQEARATAEQANRALAQNQERLELLVEERTVALQGALDEVQQRAQEQERLLGENVQQRELIRELSVPVLPVRAGTLVMPLVGALDSERLQLLQDQALAAVQRSGARHLLLDITGVPVVDSQVAQGLLAVVRAGRLMGAEVVLIGIRPEVAQALVSLGIDLAGLRTGADLQSALS